MFTSKASAAKESLAHAKANKQKAAFPAFLSPVSASLLALKQQQIDAVREMFTLQEELFLGIADTHEQTAVYLAELATLVRSDPARVESDLLKLANALPVAADRLRSQWGLTRQVLDNIGGPIDAK